MRQSGRGYELVKSLEAIARSRYARDCGRKPMGNRRATQNCDHRRSGVTSRLELSEKSCTAVYLGVRLERPNSSQ
ncbi:MAG: hypothetical protein QOE20_5464 [Mycobacterium sp.]|nr:hypothetical protein [Mycobacterium sp.]